MEPDIRPDVIQKLRRASRAFNVARKNLRIKEKLEEEIKQDLSGEVGDQEIEIKDGIVTYKVTRRSQFLINIDGAKRQKLREILGEERYAHYFSEENVVVPSSNLISKFKTGELKEELGDSYPDLLQLLEIRGGDVAIYYPKRSNNQNNQTQS